ncbi:GTP-binding protein [Halomonas sp. PAR8]|uniref:CobW family GTP-binding protein n=1 Tax=Halomonas sp. PAR8 TaxID=3075515 RepID=UPI0028853483|nr:GTP-binding protein [Halomonas sp. PAR8]MDT0592389.1 GTP-binding protein [Halomonas sp. PAR8]
MRPSEVAEAPLTVISGFLGAGKTTYLNELIRQGIPEDSLIVINDFGDINIDAELIDYRDDRMIQLSNGCLCCTLGGTLAEQLAEAMRLKQAPRAVFIETSGVADPARIADIARVSKRLKLEEVVCLVDGSRIETHRDDRLVGETWHAQIRAATRLLVNRLTGADKPQALLDGLQKLNPEALIEPMEEGRAREVRPAPARTFMTPVATGAPLDHAGGGSGGWRSASLTMSSAVDLERLQELLLEHDDVLLRAKGFVHCQRRNSRQLLQFSGGRLHFRPAPVAGHNQVVCIGRAGKRFEALLTTLATL